MNDFYEIRWHGRGGQGVVTAARLLAEAAHQGEGFAGVTAAPSFGAERRGAPVTASSRISQEPVLRRSQVYKADIVIVFDHTLLDVIDFDSQLKPGAAVVINSPATDNLNGFTDKAKTLVQVDASAIAVEEGMISSASPLVGPAMLGALVKAIPQIRLSSIETCLLDKFSGERGEKNVSMARKGNERSTMKELP